MRRRRRSPPAPEGRLRPALRAEWTKLRTIASPSWLLAGTVVATVALSAGAISAVTCTSAGCGGDSTELSLIGIQLGRMLVAVLAVLVIGSEHGTGMIATTLAAVPRRATLFAAKAITLTCVVVPAATVAVLGSLLAGRCILARRGLPGLSLADGPTFRAAVGSILSLALVALLGLGVAALVRSTAAGIGVVLALLYLFPLLAQAIGDDHWQQRLEQLAPTGGLGVTAGWAGAALVAGGLRLGRRDA